MCPINEVVTTLNRRGNFFEKQISEVFSGKPL